MLPYILAAVGVLAVGFVLLVVSRPADFTVSRSADVPAPPAEVFAKVNDLRQFDTWNPFGKGDPNMTKSYDGPAAGTGASQSWAGNSNVGVGTLSITDSRPHDAIDMRLVMVKPFACDNAVRFTFAPTAAGGTTVTWTMHGQNNFMGKLMGLLMDMDKMVGGRFEEGLANLKREVSGTATVR